MRSGVIAQKIGMTRIYNDAGEHVPVTVLRMENCQVVAQRTQEKNGYDRKDDVSADQQGEHDQEKKGRAHRSPTVPDRPISMLTALPRRRRNCGSHDWLTTNP